MAVKTSWSSGDVLTAADLTDTFAAKLDASAYTPGLALITPTSIAYSGGSASSSAGTTTFTGVSSISLNGVFTANYQNYLLVASGTNSTDDTMSMRMRASGTDNTAASYSVQVVRGIVTTSSAFQQTSQTAMNAIMGSWYNTGATAHLQIARPFEAANTTVLSTWFGRTDYVGLTGAVHAVASAFDGVTIYPGSGACTGTIRVYGYEGA